MKEKIKFTNYFLFLFLISAVFFSFKNREDNKPVKGNNNYFKLAEGITEKDFMSNTVIFKLKERNRNVAGINAISNDALNSSLNELNAGLNKMFTDAVKPLQ